jgi:hypothetical protein
MVFKTQCNYWQDSGMLERGNLLPYHTPAVGTHHEIDSCKGACLFFVDTVLSTHLQPQNRFSILYGSCVLPLWILFISDDFEQIVCVFTKQWENKVKQHSHSLVDSISSISRQCSSLVSEKLCKVWQICQASMSARCNGYVVDGEMAVPPYEKCEKCQISFSLSSGLTTLCMVAVEWRHLSFVYGPNSLKVYQNVSCVTNRA